MAEPVLHDDSLQFAALLEAGSNPDYLAHQDETGKTMLHRAAADGHILQLCALLRAGADAGAEDLQGGTPLHWAARHGHVEIISELLAVNGGLLACADIEGKTALHWAAEAGRVAVARTLLDFCADSASAPPLFGPRVDAVDKHGRTALHLAAGTGNVDVVHCLLEHAADVCAVDARTRMALHCAAGGGHAAVVGTLLECGADVRDVDRKAMTSLHFAALGGHAEVARILLEHGADVDSTASTGWTALHLAAQFGHLDVARCLLEWNASWLASWLPMAVHRRLPRRTDVLMLVDKKGSDALHWASRGGHVEVVSYLLGKGASFGAVDNEGRTALHCAALGGHVGTVALLLDMGADALVADKTGRTALHHAAEQGNAELLMLPTWVGRAKEVVVAVDSDGWSALHMAALTGRVEAMRSLMNIGATVNALNYRGDTALHLAALGGYPEAVLFLLAEGAVFSLANDAGETALHLAVQLGAHDGMDDLFAGRLGYAAAHAEGKSHRWALHDGHAQVACVLLESYLEVGAGVPVDAASSMGRLMARCSPEVVWRLWTLCVEAKLQRLSPSHKVAPHVAARKDDWPALQKVLEIRPSAVAALLDPGGTPLMVAAAWAHHGMVRDLLRTGSPDLRDSIGLSALDLAAMAEHGLQALRVLLTDDQARAMAVNENDMTALHWAAALGRCEAVQALLDAGADPLALTKASIISTETPGGPAGGVLRILERHLHGYDLPEKEYSELGGCERELGSGAHGCVYFGILDGVAAAVKRLRPSRSCAEADHASDSKAAERLRQEAVLLGRLRHRHVVSFRAWCASPPCLITEYCERGSLRDVLAGALRGGAASLSWERRLRMARGAALGMAYLHSRSPPVLHRDLKSPNLLVDDSWRVKVGDFGLSGLQGAGELPADRLNPLWAAPEVLCGAPATAASDVFSFGVVLWELLTWELPWERELGGGGPQDSAATGGGEGGLRGLLPEVRARVRAGRRPGIPSNCELPGGDREWAGLPAYTELLERCWVEDAAARPTFEEAAAELGALMDAARQPQPPDAETALKLPDVGALRLNDSAHSRAAAAAAMGSVLESDVSAPVQR